MKKKFYRNRSVFTVLYSFVILEKYVFTNRKDPISRKTFTPRLRRTVSSIFKELGPDYTRRAYRMTENDFWFLSSLLHKDIKAKSVPSHESSKKHRNGAKNGLILGSTRLSCALRYMAGGSVYDIALVHGISVPQVYASVWMVVDAVNACEELSFQFPSCHDEQKRLSKGFQDLSDADFDTCIGAIDGLLIWMDQPNPSDCELARCGPKKFFCGRKKKFGVNMMGTVDYLGRFLDVDIRHPGSTSDFLVFATSDLKDKLETHGFLAPGLGLFGDNAYVSSPYMVTPYKCARGSEDDFNFFQSQVRINVECAFGKLVHRWGILRRPLSSKIGLRRISSLVMALCRLHNFCIDSSHSQNHNLDPLAQDQVNITVNSHIELAETEDNPHSSLGILHGGEHFDDVGQSILRALRRSETEEANKCAREKLHRMVVDGGYKRPRVTV